MSVRDMGRVGRRRLAAAAFALPLVAAATVGSATVTAAPADAGRVQVSDTTLTSTSQKVTISVKLGLLEKGKLGLTPPGGSKPVQVASGTGPKTLSYTMSLACPDYDGSCVQDGRKAPARNGKWTVTFGSTVLVLGSGSESSFVVAAPPKAPTGVTASASGRDVTVRWRKGAEPDLSSYKVKVGSQSERVSAPAACGGSCSAVLTGPAGGGKTPVSVTATRDGYGSPISSSAAKTNVNVAKPASAGRSSGAGTSGLPGTGTGAGTGSGGSAAGGAGGAGFPTPNLRPGETLPGGLSGSAGMPSSNPYPSFGVQPKVAPATSSSPASANRSNMRPLAYGHARGDAAVPVAMALVLVLAGGHVLLLSRGGRLRPALAAGMHRATRSRRRQNG